MESKGGGDAKDPGQSRERTTSFHESGTLSQNHLLPAQGHTSAAQHPPPWLNLPPLSSSGTGGRRASRQMSLEAGLHPLPLLSTPTHRVPGANRHIHGHLHKDTHHSLTSMCAQKCKTQQGHVQAQSLQVHMHVHITA